MDFSMQLRLLLFSVLVFLFSCSDGSSNNPLGGSGNNGGSSSYSHTQNVGASAHDLLSEDDFNSLTIEIDYVSGFQPSSAALENLRNFLEARINKSAGITINLDDEIPSPNIDTISVEQVYELEKQHRDTFTSDKDIAVYFLFLDNSYENENVLGFAYLNTSMTIFKEVIENHTWGFGQPSSASVESAVTLHEFGHILGLVDNGSPALEDHVDTEHGAHCTNEECLMYWAVQTTDLMGFITGGTIPNLDEACLNDLKANGGK